LVNCDALLVYSRQIRIDDGEYERPTARFFNWIGVRVDTVFPLYSLNSSRALAAAFRRSRICASDNPYPQAQVPLSYYESTAPTAFSTTYMTLSGTSMATAVVSGAAAVLLTQHPGLSPDQVKARLMQSAYKTFPATSLFFYFP
jgi:subtilisin family serine protease